MQSLQRRHFPDQTPLSVKNIYAKPKINFGNITSDSKEEHLGGGQVKHSSPYGGNKLPRKAGQTDANLFKGSKDFQQRESSQPKNFDNKGQNGEKKKSRNRNELVQQNSKVGANGTAAGGNENQQPGQANSYALTFSSTGTASYIPQKNQSKHHESSSNTMSVKKTQHLHLQNVETVQLMQQSMKKKVGNLSLEKYKKGESYQLKGDLNVSIKDIKKLSNEPQSCTNKSKEGNAKQLTLQTFQANALHANIKLSRSQFATPKYIQFQANQNILKQNVTNTTQGLNTTMAATTNYTTRNMQNSGNSKVATNTNANNTQLYESNLDTSVCKGVNLDRSYQQIASHTQLVGAQKGNAAANEDASVNKSILRPTSSSTFNLENSYMQPPPISEIVTPSNNVNLITCHGNQLNVFNQPLTSTAHNKQKFIFNKKSDGEQKVKAKPKNELIKNPKVNHSSLIQNNLSNRSSRSNSLQKEANIKFINNVKNKHFGRGMSKEEQTYCPYTNEASHMKQKVSNLSSKKQSISSQYHQALQLAMKTERSSSQKCSNDYLLQGSGTNIANLSHIVPNQEVASSEGASFEVGRQMWYGLPQSQEKKSRGYSIKKILAQNEKVQRKRNGEFRDKNYDQAVLSEELKQSRPSHEDALQMQHLMDCMAQKDQLIESLLSRIQCLEEKFSEMQQQERRDKSSQRINQVIQNLEQKLELFSQQKVAGMQKLALLASVQSSQRKPLTVKATPHLASTIKMSDDLESLVTIMDGEDFPPINSTSIKTPAVEELEKFGGEIEEEEEENEELMSEELIADLDLHNQHQFDLSLNNIQILMNCDDELNKTNDELVEGKKQFLQTQKILHLKGVESDIISSPNQILNFKKASEQKVKSKGKGACGNATLSKTQSKNSLLSKIRSAMGKQNLTIKQRDNSNNNDKKKTPKRLIVKKSKERGEECEPQVARKRVKKLSKNSDVDLNVLRCGGGGAEKATVNDENGNALLNNKKRGADREHKEREKSNKLRLAIAKMHEK